MPGIALTEPSIWDVSALSKLCMVPSIDDHSRVALKGGDIGTHTVTPTKFD